MTQTADPAATTTTAANSPLSERERGAGGVRSFPRYPAYRDSGVPWLGAIPARWEMKRLKYVVSINDDALSESTPPDRPLQYLDIGNVDTDGYIRDAQQLVFADAPSRARRLVRDGDTIISTVRTYLRAIAFMEQPTDDLVVSTGFAVLRPRQGVDPKYLWRLVQSAEFVDAVVSHSEGVGYPAINPGELATLPVWLPPLAEQRAIAAFLDRETARIDALVAAKRRLIDLLREKRAALISRAVTRGLDAGVPLRESGMPAVGNIPAHWQIKRNKTIFREAGERSLDGQEELLTVSHITGVTRRSEKDVTMIMAESFEGYKLCRPGDLAVNTMWAWMGAVGIARELGIVSPSYNVYRLRAELAAEYDPEYLDLLYRTPAYVCEINRYSQGIWDSRLRLYPEAFFSMLTLTPPVHEQRQIVEYCRSEMAHLGAFGQKLSESIERLREYRTALIAAAVTGAIDVRGQVAGDGTDGERESAE